jgi:5-methylcytosine-specific restriction protein B
MARWAPAAAIYEVADLFRANCLTTGTSLLWPDHRAWTVETIDALLEAFIGRLDEGKESFFEKWRKQLADQSSDVHRVAADALAFFYLFPDQITGDTKIRNVRTVLGWKLGDEGDPAAWPRIEAAFRRGVGGTGPFYTRNLPYGIAYFLTFARTVHERRIPTTDEEALVALADETQDAVKSSRAARHVLLHLLFPDRFERIASGEHKRKIVDAFAAGAAGNEDLDEAILAIRHEIEERTDRPGFDFYDEPDLFTAWNSDPKQADEADFAALHGLVERAYPDPAVRQICLNVLADSIKLAHTVSPASWSLNPRRGQGNLRLNVGPTQACVLSENDLYLVLDRDRLSPELQQRVDTEMVGEDRQGAAYRGTPFAYGAHLPANRLDELLPLVVEAHRSYIGRAAHSMPRTRYQEGHRPESVAFLRQQLGRDLPNPVYGRGEPNPTGDPLTDTGRNPDGEGTTAPSLSALATTAHMPEHEIAEIVDLLRDKRQIILEGPPGSGKTFLADLLARHLAGIPLDGETDERVETVQFHQSYGYEDFVQGIRPDTTSGGSLVYTVVPGIFTRLCARAAANPGQEFVLIVDEINRGNVSRIFGELLMLLEYRDKRVRLPYSAGDGPDAYLSIPPNLFLIGTMNSTDRSLALIDYALRRRFYFYRLLPMRDGRAPVLETWLARQEIPEADRVRLLRLFLVLNRRVEERLSPEFQVGHSYFMRGDIQTEAVLGRVWRHAVLPLLEEYLHGARDRQQELAEFALERLAADPADSLPDQVIPLPGQTATS